MNSVSFFIVSYFHESVFTACRPVSALIFLSSVSSVVPAIIVGTTVLVRRVHARMCLYARDENRFNWMCTRCGRRRATAHIVNAPFNCSLGVYAQGGGESSLRHTNTHQRFISVST